MTTIGSLTVEGAFDGSHLTLLFKGEADMRDGAPLTTHLLEWHQQLLEKQSKQVAIDLRAVEFMNSTALGAFVKWVAEVQKLEKASRYQIILEGTQARRWQRASLHALASFAPENIQVTFP